MGNKLPRFRADEKRLITQKHYSKHRYSWTMMYDNDSSQPEYPYVIFFEIFKDNGSAIEQKVFGYRFKRKEDVYLGNKINLDLAIEEQENPLGPPSSTPPETPLGAPPRYTPPFSKNL